MVKQESKDAIFGARLFYTGIMISTLAIFLYYDNDLQKSIRSFNFAYFLAFFGLYGLCFYLFYTCGENPGFVDLLTNEDGGHIELTVTHTDQDGSESLLQPQTSVSSDEGIPQLRKSIQDSGQENENNHEVINIEKRKKKNNEQNGLEMRFCEECKVLQPYRTKHCDLCERCVHKFDHHCFWVGGCVGELNHRKFWIFLFFQTFLELWAYIIADSGVDSSYTKKAETRSSTKDSPYTSSEYGAFTVLIVILFLAFLFTGILGGFHTFLILTNQTTWEYAKKEKITYMKIYPRSFYPFSQGIWGNLKLIFFHGNRLRTWELPPVEYARQKRGFNWCENEYWSCC